jgi:glutamyl-tRNA(Gln) amidotransferase subunit D
MDIPGRAAEYLISRGIKPGDYVIVKLVEGVVFRGILLPRPEIYASSSLIVVKLENGYNVGLDLGEDRVDRKNYYRRKGKTG